MQVVPTLMAWNMRDGGAGGGVNARAGSAGGGLRRGGTGDANPLFYFYVRNVASEKRRIALTTPSSRRFKIQLLATGTKELPPNLNPLSGALATGTLPPIESDVTGASGTRKAQKKKHSKARLLPFGSHIVMKLPANGWCHFSVEAAPSPASASVLASAPAASAALPPATPKLPRQLCSDQLLLFECEDPRVDAARVALLAARAASGAAMAHAAMAHAMSTARRSSSTRAAKEAKRANALLRCDRRFADGVARVEARVPCQCFARVRLVQVRRSLFTDSFFCLLSFVCSYSLFASLQYTAAATAKRSRIDVAIEADAVSQMQPLPGRFPKAPACPCGRGCRES